MEVRSRTNQRRPSVEVSPSSKPHPATLDAHSNSKLSHDGETAGTLARYRSGLTHACHLGECKPLIAEYLRCLRRVKGMNDAECRTMAKHYLKCRMDQYVVFYILYFTLLRRRTNGALHSIWEWRLITPTISSNLMAPDEFRNLGFPEEDRVEPVPNHAGGATSHRVRDDGKKIT